MLKFGEFLLEMATRENDLVKGSYHVLRLGRKGGKLSGSNAGNHKGLAVHLGAVDDFERGTNPSGTHVNVYKVKSMAKKGEYKPAGKNNPDTSDEVGVNHRPWGATWYSFGKKADAKHKLVKSIPLKDIRDHMKKTYGYDDFDESGHEIGAKAVHDMVKKYISEVRLMRTINKEEKFDRIRNLSDKDLKKERFTKMSDIDNDHEVYRSGGTASYSKQEWIIRHKGNGDVVMSVDGLNYKHPKKLGTTGFKVDVLSGSAKSPVKAHEFYKHLIDKHNIILQSSNNQSTGGMKVWRKLHRDPDVHVHSLDHFNDAHHVDKVGRGTTHATETDLEKINQRQAGAGDNWKNASAFFMMKRKQKLSTLVAHKKSDSIVAEMKKPRWEVPAEPGSTPAPEGKVKLYHQTGEKNLNSIRKQGIKLSHAKGYEGPKAIYASPPDSKNRGFYGPAHSTPTAEFHIDKKDYSAPFVRKDSVPAKDITAHKEWHATVRYIDDDPELRKSVERGDHDSLMKQGKGDKFAKAVRFVRKRMKSKQ